MLAVFRPTPTLQPVLRSEVCSPREEGETGYDSAVSLPITPPFAPMEAQSAAQLPASGVQYEPKWDGFRCIAFRDNDQIFLQSKAGLPLGRYFPEVVGALQRLEPRTFVLDGELVVPVADRLDFDQLLGRIHPAATRVKKLADEFQVSRHIFGF